jgi:hypothetical protein
MGKAPFVMFAVLMLASVSILTLATQEASPRLKGETPVDADGVLNALLSSTVDDTTYSDIEGNTSHFIGWTVQALLVQDLEIRSNRTLGSNNTSLENGIEDAISELLKGVSGQHHYQLKVSFRFEHLTITDVGISEGAKAQAHLPMRTFDGSAEALLVMTE